MSELAALKEPPPRSDLIMRPAKLFLCLKSASLARITFAVVVVCVVAQVALGANLIVLALAMISCLAGLAGLRIAGAYRSGAWLAFFFVLGNVVVALVAKTVCL